MNKFSKDKQINRHNLRNIKDSIKKGYEIIYDENNLIMCKCIFCGPDDTIYETTIYELSIKFNDVYEFPTIKFLTPISHPNIYLDGSIDVENLFFKKFIMCNLYTILEKIILLLKCPIFNNVCNQEALLLYNTLLERKEIKYNNHCRYFSNTILKSDKMECIICLEYAEYTKLKCGHKVCKICVNKINKCYYRCY